ncbi:CvpA family protein [Flagellimonas zhangzhouensis]|uniref:Membrane protein required for colicin V production n=1 Tax=Flagellimonas zhangzhouensis TaxID=1073328 RepID=A0A1H2V4B9_9FLAO|nr:CvpA family protein [Allomuricauda zhangzhouensis]SDQ10975.1 membrane protein required for colicin V production [Allomuricauda zhangzhouensis]SDW63151.1 membrane protein required for colicin V production [Allomuricauda zhangzhouensis]
MSFLDIIFGILLIWGLYKGLRNGLFVELASLVALIAGLYGAIHFSYITGEYLADRLDWNEQYIQIAAFLITFFAIIIVVNLAGKLLTKIADFAMLGLLNKIAGGIFGLLKVAVILGALLIFFERLTSPLNMINEETKAQSVFYEPIKEIGALVFSLVLEDEIEDVPEIEPRTETL